jgi:dipeptidyl aminopeptidase/acylaminoacyl peptidase
MTRLFVSAALTLLTANVFAQNGAQYPLRQYLSVRGAGSPTISPDGSQVAFRTNITGTSQVWRVSASSGWPDQLTFFPSSVQNPAWSPKGDRILVPADNNGDEQFQLYAVTPDGSRLTPLTANPKVRHNFGGWSSDGKKVLYSSNARDARYFDCYVMDVESKSERMVFKKDAVLFPGDLSPDGKLFAAVEFRSNVDSDVYIVDMASGAEKPVTPHTGEVLTQVIGFSADSRTLLVSTNRDREFQNLATIDVASGQMRYLHNEPHDVDGAALSNNRKRLAFTLNKDGFLDPEVMDVESGKRMRLPELPRGIITLGGFTADSRQLAVAINTPTRKNDVWILNLDKRQSRQVTHSSLAGIDPSTFAEISLIKFKSFDGREIPAFLYLPKNAPQDKSLPVMLSVHGGPEGQEQPYFTPLYQYFVSRGYAILLPNIRGSTGYGKAYLNLDNADKRWDALKDLASAVDYVKIHPSLDARKVAIFGGSYGGFAVLAMLTHYPDLFAAGVDLFGIADFKTFLANTAPFRRPLRIAEYGDPEKHGAFMDAISPLKHAARIKAPLMIIQGANDPRVPESESRQIADSVKAKGGVVEYLLFPDEGHGIAKLPNRIKAYEAMVDFLNRHIRSNR